MDVLLWLVTIVPHGDVCLEQYDVIEHNRVLSLRSGDAWSDQLIFSRWSPRHGRLRMVHWCMRREDMRPQIDHRADGVFLLWFDYNGRLREARAPVLLRSVTDHDRVVEHPDWPYRNSLDLP